MPWGAIAGAVIGGVMQNQAAKKSAKASQQGGDAAIAEQRRQYDQSRTDQAPWMQAGAGALGQMQALNGGDFSSFKESPDYAWALQNGQEGMDRGAAARGRMYSGGYDADRMQFNSGIASQNYGSFYNRLQSMAGQGQTTAGNLGSLGAAMAGNIGNAQIGAANARASSYQQQGNNYADMAYAGGNAFGNWYQNRKASQQNTKPQLSQQSIPRTTIGYNY